MLTIKEISERNRILKNAWGVQEDNTITNSIITNGIVVQFTVRYNNNYECIMSIETESKKSEIILYVDKNFSFDNMIEISVFFDINLLVKYYYKEVCNI